MKAIVHVNHAEHQKTHAAYMRKGLERHGIKVEFAPANTPMSCDFAVIWGWRQKAVIESGVNVLVMERGHIQPRMELTSCGWNGLGNRAIYPKAPDEKRWERLFSNRFKPWNRLGKNVIVFGQVRNDAAVSNLQGGFHAWAEWACKEAKKYYGMPVIYRPHPLSLTKGDAWAPDGFELSRHELSFDLDRAAVGITYNSTSGVDAVLGGVPVVALDEGSMAYPVAAKEINSSIIRPKRAKWCHDLAWTTWHPQEIANGDAWEALRQCPVNLP